VSSTTEEQTTNPAPDATTGPASDGQGSETAKKKTKAPDTSGITADAINAATLATPDLRQSSQPVRVRKPEQLAMDAVAARAYKAWVDAKKPTAWDKMPVITYFLDDAEAVRSYRFLIVNACRITPSVTEGISGVRARFGNEFTLSEEMAKNVKRPEMAGKIVLAWTAIDKRAAGEDKSATAATTNAMIGEKPKTGEKPKK
jgi:hypothetical protein